MLDPKDFPSPLILDVGAGDVVTPGVVRVDPFYPETDVKAMMWDIPFPDGSVDMIHSNNSLEHVAKADVIPTLREWHRLLKDGGTLILVVPDLEWACKFWLECQATEWSMDIIYGNQNHEGEFHKTGFSKQILWDYLVTANPGEWFVNELEFMPDTGVYTKEYHPLGTDGQMVRVLFKDVHQRLIRLVAYKANPENAATLGLVEKK